MRDIKFRVWDKYNKFFNSDYAINGNLVWGACEGEIIKEKEHLVFMQYTGLKDKSGKEICEGDIVVRDENPFIVKIPRIYFPTCNIGELKVIGNIYENPELVKEAK